MTRQRNDSHSTEFGLWLRKQDCIGSKRTTTKSNQAFVASNLDYLWEDYISGQWIIIEEKRYNSKLTFPQERQFKKLNDAIGCELFRGFFILTFEKTNPEDGRIFLRSIHCGQKQNVTITKEELFLFLQFKRTMADFRIDRIRKECHNAGGRENERKAAAV